MHFYIYLILGCLLLQWILRLVIWPLFVLLIHVLAGIGRAVTTGKQREPTWKDCVFHHLHGEIIGGLPAAPGWYFWDETWTEYHGPYRTSDAARVAVDDYCEEVLGFAPMIKDKKWQRGSK